MREQELNLDDLIRSTRDADQPSRAHADKVFNKIVSGLGPSAPGGATPDGLVPVDTTALAHGAGTIASEAARVVATKSALKISAVWALGGSVLLGGAAWWTIEQMKPSSEPVSLRDANPPENSPQQLAPAEKDIKVSEDLLAEPNDGRDAPKPPTKRSQPQRKPDTLSQEVALVREAKLALDAKRPEEALRLLDDYRRIFPKGSLRGEAQATRVLVLCALQQAGAAESAAAELEEDSPLGKRMKAGCKAH